MNHNYLSKQPWLLSLILSFSVSSSYAQTFKDALDYVQENVAKENFYERCLEIINSGSEKTVCRLPKPNSAFAFLVCNESDECDISGEIDNLMYIAKKGILVVSFDTEYFNNIACYKDRGNKTCQGFIEKWYDEPFSILPPSFQPADTHKCASKWDYTKNYVQNELDKSKERMLIDMRNQTPDKKKATASSFLNIAKLSMNNMRWIKDLQGFLLENGNFLVADPGGVVEEESMSNNNLACFYNWTCALALIMDESEAKSFCKALD